MTFPTQVACAGAQASIAAPLTAATRAPATTSTSAGRTEGAREGEALIQESGTARAGRRNQPVKSEAYLFCYAGGRWPAKYRFPYPADQDVRAVIDAFMRDLAWTIQAAT